MNAFTYEVVDKDGKTGHGFVVLDTYAETAKCLCDSFGDIQKMTIESAKRGLMVPIDDDAYNAVTNYKSVMTEGI